MRHFLKSTDFSYEEMSDILEMIVLIKTNSRNNIKMQGQSWGMLFYKKSTRTRVSFEIGLRELGANPVFFHDHTLQLSRGETITDTAIVLSRYLNGLIIRCNDHALLESFASVNSIPIINALSSSFHPCQIYADLFTLSEQWGKKGKLSYSLIGKKLVFIGNTSSNMAYSWLLGGITAGMEIVLCGPSYNAGTIVEELKTHKFNSGYSFTTKVLENADAVYTDVWISMGEEENTSKKRIYYQYKINSELMAKKNSFFLHCLPAHVGQEVTRDVINSPKSIVYVQAENRLHAQKAIIIQLACRYNIN